MYNEAPERPHTVIALWDVQGSSDGASALRTAALAQAAALGADAAIITVNEQLMIMCLPSGYLFVCGEGDIPIYTNQTDLKARFIVWR